MTLEIPKGSEKNTELCDFSTEVTSFTSKLSNEDTQKLCSLLKIGLKTCEA